MRNNREMQTTGRRPRKYEKKEAMQENQQALDRNERWRLACRILLTAAHPEDQEEGRTTPNAFRCLAPFWGTLMDTDLSLENVQSAIHLSFPSYTNASRNERVLWYNCTFFIAIVRCSAVFSVLIGQNKEGLLFVWLCLVVLWYNLQFTRWKSRYDELNLSKLYNTIFCTIFNLVIRYALSSGTILSYYELFWTI